MQDEDSETESDAAEQQEEEEEDEMQDSEEDPSDDEAMIIEKPDGKNSKISKNSSKGKHQNLRVEHLAGFVLNTDPSAKASNNSSTEERKKDGGIHALVNANPSSSAMDTSSSEGKQQHQPSKLGESSAAETMNAALSGALELPPSVLT